MENKEDLLRIYEQIYKLKKDSKIRCILICIYLPLMIGLSIYLITLKKPAELGIGFLYSTPFSICFGYILPARANHKKINELMKKLSAKENTFS